MTFVMIFTNVRFHGLLTAARAYNAERWKCWVTELVVVAQAWRVLMARRRHPRVYVPMKCVRPLAYWLTYLSLNATLSKPWNCTFVNIITKVMNPVKGEHTVVGYSPPLLLYTLCIYCASRVKYTETLYIQVPCTMCRCIIFWILTCRNI